MWSVEFTQSVLTHNDWLFRLLLFCFIIVVFVCFSFVCCFVLFLFVVCLFALFCVVVVVVVLGGVQLASRWKIMQQAIHKSPNL